VEDMRGTGILEGTWLKLARSSGLSGLTVLQL
jgi:hypothetical protein